MNAQETAQKVIVLLCIWAALLLAPYWMPPLGGYIAYTITPYVGF